MCFLPFLFVKHLQSPLTKSHVYRCVPTGANPIDGALPTEEDRLLREVSTFGWCLLQKITFKLHVRLHLTLSIFFTSLRHLERL